MAVDCASAYFHSAHAHRMHESSMSMLRNVWHISFTSTYNVLHINITEARCKYSNLTKFSNTFNGISP